MNRSLAGEIYLGVRTIRWDDDTPVWSDLIDREAIRRMEVPAIADEVVLELGLPGAVETLWEMFSKGQRVPVRRYQRLAQRVAMFHQSERDLGEHHFELEFRAHVARQNSYWREFFSAFARHESRALDPFCQRALQESIAFLFAFQREYIDLLEERARAGFVVKGHGELDMRHVVLQKDSSAAIGRRPRSNPQEYFDVLLEVATLVTELEARGARREASAFEAAYIRHYPQSWNEKIYRYYRVLASLQHAVRTDSLGEDPAEVHRQLFYSFDVAFSFPRASLVVFSAAEQQSAEALARSVAEYYPLRSIRIDVLGNRSARGELRQIELCTALDRA
ncbi:MAG: hypothetical protein KDD44_13930, partial [Bdellovibrionales bacterium]|nr:hypothetical protein [Bdellovibrionales bacterium]